MAKDQMSKSPNAIICPVHNKILKKTTLASIREKESIWTHQCALFYCNECQRYYVHPDGYNSKDDKKFVFEPYRNSEVKATTNVPFWNSEFDPLRKRQTEREKIAAENAKRKEEEERRKKEKAEIRIQEILKKKAEAEERQKALEELNRKKEPYIKEINESFVNDYLNSYKSFKAIQDNLVTEEEFFNLRKEYVRKWFKSYCKKHSQKEPDEDQLEAIACTNKNIEVVARAGSGKTSTLINRAIFLVNNCGVDPKSILMLAFNKKAASEMESRFKSTADEGSDGLPHAMTFHALAYSIVHPKESMLYDDPESGGEILSRFIQDIINDLLRSISYGIKIRKVMLAKFTKEWYEIVKGGFNLKDKYEQLQYRRGMTSLSLNGDYIKSEGERIIANYLFENDISYKYELPHKWKRGNYRPDFTITATEEDLIIEYFGLQGNPEYDRQMDEKREFIRSSEKTEMIEILYEDMQKGAQYVENKLKEELLKHGIKGRKLSEDEIWKKIKDRDIGPFTETVKTFIGRCRKAAWTLDDLKYAISEYNSDSEIENTFHEITVEVYKRYLERLEKENSEDFDGLIIKAIDMLSKGETRFFRKKNEGDFRNIKYIFVDEYQDFSYLFESFLDQIRKKNPESWLFCVGDDWQAINAFAGSDLKYFNSFLSKYSDSIRLYLKNNYRSGIDIVETANRFMAIEQDSGPRIKAFKKENGEVLIADIHGKNLFSAIQRITDASVSKKEKIVLLSRTNDRLISNIYEDNYYKKDTAIEKLRKDLSKDLSYDERKYIEAVTTHKFKGCEAPTVIILDAARSFYPFIHPDWYFMSLFGDTIEKLVEDEERLFYVALTRAIKKLIIFTDGENKSPFMFSIEGMKCVKRINWDDYPIHIKSDHYSIVVKNTYDKFSSGTYKIKEALKKDGFIWANPVWRKTISEYEYDIENLKKSAWGNVADKVTVTITDSNHNIKETFMITNGSWKDANDKRGM